MPQITAITNVGSPYFRMLKAGRTIDLSDEQMDEGINRLWMKGAIKIDGKIYEEEKVEEVESQKPQVNTKPAATSPVVGPEDDLKEDPKTEVERPGPKTGQSIDDVAPEEVKEKDEDPAKETEAPVEDPEPETDPETPETDGDTGPVNPDEEPPAAETAEVPAEESTTEDAKDEEKTEGSGSAEESDPVDNSVLEYMNSQPAGFFSQDALDTLSVDELKVIGGKINIDIKRRKQGVTAIMKTVSEVMK